MTQEPTSSEPSEPAEAACHPIVDDFFKTDIGNYEMRYQEIMTALTQHKVGEKFYGNVYCLEIGEQQVAISNVHDDAVPVHRVDTQQFATQLQHWFDLKKN